MSNLSHSAGLPGVPRCSEATTGTKPRGARRGDGPLVHRQELGLSFFSITETTRGRRVAQCAFDVPRQSPSAGNLTGYRAAAELFRLLQAEGSTVHSDWLLQQVLGEVLTALAEELEGHSRLGAAAGFMLCMRQAVLAAAGRFDMPTWCEGMATRQEERDRLFDEADKARGLAAGARLRVAKAAKRAERLADRATNQASAS